MAGRFRAWWDRYRHFRAALGLVTDILSWLGIKATVFAAITAAMAYLVARIERLAGAELFVLAICAFAGALVLFLALLYLLQMREGRTPSLKFIGWHAGEGRYPTKFMENFPSWIGVGNPSTAIPLKARNVTAHIDWLNDAGTTRPIVPEAQWYVIGQNNEGWRLNADIEAGENQSFVFFAKDTDGKIWIYKNSGVPIAVLGQGHWTATISVQSDNMRGFKGSLGFTVLKNGGTAPDGAHFVVHRRLSPRLVGHKKWF